MPERPAQTQVMELAALADTIKLLNDEALLEFPRLPYGLEALGGGASGAPEALHPPLGG